MISDIKDGTRSSSDERFPEILNLKTNTRNQNDSSIVQNESSIEFTDRPRKSESKKPKRTILQKKKIFEPIRISKKFDKADSRHTT